MRVVKEILAIRFKIYFIKKQPIRPVRRKVKDNAKILA